MAERIFVDTNVLLYAHDLDEPGKHEVAQTLVENLWAERNGALSTQVLQEFYVGVTRKIRRAVTRPEGRSLIRRYADWWVHQVTAEDVVEAAELEERRTLNFWDALIVVAAKNIGAARLLTEDLQHGQILLGVRIENPFRA